MLANLPVEIILLICEYPEFKDLGQLAWTTKRMMQIIKKHLPIALVLERKTLFYLSYRNGNIYEGRICLFNLHTNSVKQIAKFHNWYWPRQVATTQNKIFGIGGRNNLFEIYDLDTRQISRGPDPPEWRQQASAAYLKDKLYYLGGWDRKTGENTNRVDVLIDGKWQTGPAFLRPIIDVQTITCNGILYVIDGYYSGKIYRLSDDEREWIEVGELPEERVFIGAASLNGRIYITGGQYDDDVFKSCLCFDPSAPVDGQISRIADMNYARNRHSLVVANEKLYAIGGFPQDSWKNCDPIEEYDPQTNEWRKVGELKSETVQFNAM